MKISGYASLQSAPFFENLQMVLLNRWVFAHSFDSNRSGTAGTISVARFLTVPNANYVNRKNFYSLSDLAT